MAPKTGSQERPALIPHAFSGVSRGTITAIPCGEAPLFAWADQPAYLLLPTDGGNLI